jgi:hypothetical protein
MYFLSDDGGVAFAGNVGLLGVPDVQLLLFAKNLFRRANLGFSVGASVVAGRS